jgi:hypothetical protein
VFTPIKPKHYLATNDVIASLQSFGAEKNKNQAPMQLIYLKHTRWFRVSFLLTAGSSKSAGGQNLD